MDEEKKSPLEIAEEKRAARKAARAKESDAQKAIDTDAISALEEEHGDGRVKAIDVPYHPGHVTKIACRCLTKVELKVYRARIKPKKDGTPPDLAAAAEEVGRMCLIYPDEKRFDALLELFPGLLGHLGQLAANLSAGNEEAEKKA